MITYNLVCVTVSHAAASKLGLNAVHIPQIHVSFVAVEGEAVSTSAPLRMPTWP